MQIHPKTGPSRVAALMIGLLLGLVGCAPIHASHAIDDAETRMEEARRADAPHLAPYPWWLARAYLDKAKRTEGYAEHEGARELAREAAVHFEQATNQARQERKRQELRKQRLQKRPSGEGSP
ncbi:MAG: DUF4398 domain-containing protein [Myxococcota bacterium]